MGFFHDLFCGCCGWSESVRPSEGAGDDAPPPGSSVTRPGPYIHMAPVVPQVDPTESAGSATRSITNQSDAPSMLEQRGWLVHRLFTAPKTARICRAYLAQIERGAEFASNHGVPRAKWTDVCCGRDMLVVPTAYNCGAYAHVASRVALYMGSVVGAIGGTECGRIVPSGVTISTNRVPEASGLGSYDGFVNLGAYEMTLMVSNGRSTRRVVVPPGGMFVCEGTQTIKRISGASICFWFVLRTGNRCAETDDAEVEFCVQSGAVPRLSSGQCMVSLDDSGIADTSVVTLGLYTSPHWTPSASTRAALSTAYRTYYYNRG